MGSLGAFLAGGGAVMRGINQGNDEQDARDFTTRVRASGVRRMDAEDSLMPAETAAKSATLGLQTDAAIAARGTLPARTRLETTQTGIAQRTADYTLGQLGKLFDLKDTETATALNKAKVGLEQSKFDLESLPGLISKAKAGKAIDDVKTADMLMGGLGHALTIGDKALTQRYLQGIADSGIFPQAKGAKIGEIGTMEGPDGKPLLVVQDDQGNPLLAIPGQKITDSYTRMNPADMKVLAEGASGWVQRNGQWVKVAENPKDFKPADQIASTAAEQKNLDMRMSRGAAIINKNLGVDSMTGLLPESRPKHAAMIKRMGELVRSGVDPEKAATDAIAEVEDADKRSKASGDKGGKAPAGGKSIFTPWK